MPFTYSIQKVDFFADQVKEMGEVDLEGALEAFENFPFAQQLKEISDRDMSSCLPTITFHNDDKKLAIWASDDKGFCLMYMNGSGVSDFYISNDITQSGGNYTVEDFIAMFFDGTIENSLEISVTEATGEKEHVELENSIVSFSAEGKNNLGKFWNTGLILILGFYGVIKLPEPMSQLLVGLFAVTLTLPGIILYITYRRASRGVTVTVDPEAKTIKYEKNGRTTVVKREEIVECRIHEARRSSLRFMQIIAANNVCLVINNFIVEPSELVGLLNLHYRKVDRLFPFIMRPTSTPNASQ